MKKFGKKLLSLAVLAGLSINFANPLAEVQAQEEDLVVDVFVEIPTGSSNKYEYDEEKGGIILDRVLYSPLYYPTEYGSIFGTEGGDGDPLDALVIVSHPTFPGVIIEVRVIGMLDMIDGGEADEKLLAVPTNDPRFDEIRSLEDIEPHVLDEIAHFFEVYKDLEGKEVEVVGWTDVEEATEVLQNSIDTYNANN